MPTDMNAMMRNRRKEMADMPMYEGPPPKKAVVAVSVGPDEEQTEPVDNPSEEAAEPSGGITVAAPGEKSSGEGFEYEPLPNIPGAWVVYPPGVPCDDTEYRVQIDHPAAEGDFAKMQTALDDAGATGSGASSDVSSPDDPGLEGTY